MIKFLPRYVEKSIVSPFNAGILKSYMDCCTGAFCPEVNILEINDANPITTIPATNIRLVNFIHDLFIQGIDIGSKKLHRPVRLDKVFAKIPARFLAGLFF